MGLIRPAECRENRTECSVVASITYTHSLTEPRNVPISWVAEDGLVVPVYADGEDDRAERAELDGFLGMLSLAGLAIHPRGWLQPHPHHDGVCLTNDGDDSDSADLHASDVTAAPSRADAC